MIPSVGAWRRVLPLAGLVAVLIAGCSTTGELLVPESGGEGTTETANQNAFGTSARNLDNDERRLFEMLAERGIVAPAAPCLTLFDPEALLEALPVEVVHRPRFPTEAQCPHSDWIGVGRAGDPEVVADPGRSEELLQLDEALSRLQVLDDRLGRVVELRFFAGLSVEEVAGVLGMSPRSVKRDWRKARAFLYQEMRGAEAPLED